VKTKLNPALAGMFVLGAFVLMVAAILSFHSTHLFSTPARFVAYFNESVQGLDNGSAVKLRGVRVGRVQAIQVHYDSKARQSQVAVIGELDQNVISDAVGQRIKITERATLERLIQEGLRAKIDLVGITGLQFVELDFLDPQQFPASPTATEAKYPVVPTVRSGMSEMIENLSKIVTDLHKADVAELSRELKSLLTTANRQIGDLDLKAMVTKITAAAESIEALAGSAEARAVFGNLNKTTTEVQGLVTKLDAQVEPVQAELVRTLRSFHDAAESVHKLLRPGSGLGEEAVRTLQQVTETAESLQRLTEFLERNPNALITGKKRPGKEP
jgi:paraquat-inducible protein B